MSAELVHAATIGALVFGAVTLLLIVVRVIERMQVRGKTRVRATVVSFEMREDPSYSRKVPFPIVELTWNGAKTTSVVVAGVLYFSDKPVLKIGQTIDVWIDPMSPHESRSLTSLWAPWIALFFVSIAVAVVVYVVNSN